MIYSVISRWFALFLAYNRPNRPNIREFRRKYGLKSTLREGCTHCGKNDCKKLYNCARCATPYCSPECQQAAWPKHRVGLCSKPGLNFNEQHYMRKAGTLFTDAIVSLPSLHSTIANVAVNGYRAQGKGHVGVIFEPVGRVFTTIERFINNGAVRLEAGYLPFMRCDYDPNTQFVVVISVIPEVGGIARGREMYRICSLKPPAFIDERRLRWIEEMKAKADIAGKQVKFSVFSDGIIMEEVEYSDCDDIES